MLSVRNPIRPDVLYAYFAEEKPAFKVCQRRNSTRPDVMYFAGDTCGPLRGSASLLRHATRPACAAPGAGSKKGDHPTIDIDIYIYLYIYIRKSSFLCYTIPIWNKLSSSVISCSSVSSFQCSLRKAFAADKFAYGLT